MRDIEAVDNNSVPKWIEMNWASFWSVLTFDTPFLWFGFYGDWQYSQACAKGCISIRHLKETWDTVQASTGAKISVNQDYPQLLDWWIWSLAVLASKLRDCYLYQKGRNNPATSVTNILVQPIFCLVQDTKAQGYSTLQLGQKLSLKLESCFNWVLVLVKWVLWKVAPPCKFKQHTMRWPNRWGTTWTQTYILITHM